MVVIAFTYGYRLTVEHIWFYGRLKGLSAAAIGLEQDRLLQDLGLVPKWHAQTSLVSPAWEGVSSLAGDEAGEGAGTLSQG